MQADLQAISDSIVALVEAIEGVGSPEQFDALTLELYWRARLLRDQVSVLKAAKRRAMSAAI
uniref:Uncharacterized protein n=2 Tax=Paracidobacterium acidisoli TaxID=2303751 RepID=A0A372ILW1_9BACT